MSFITKKQKKINEMEEQINDLQDEIRNLQNVVKDVSNIQSEISAIGQQIDSINNSIAKKQQFNKSKDDELDRKIASTNEWLKKTREDMWSNRSSLSDLRVTVSDLKDTVSDLKVAVSDVDRKLYSSNDYIAKTRREMERSVQKFVECYPYDELKRELIEASRKWKFEELNQNEIDICGAMPDGDRGVLWGDYHFAMAMKKNFERLGYKANVLPRNHWYEKSSAKYVIVLRGTIPYYPIRGKERKYVMWNISHPDEVCLEEYNAYDYVFFASQKMTGMWSDKIRPHSSTLLQCADTDNMKYVEGTQNRYELLFVGNSRNVYRRILRDLLPTTYELSVYGSYWDDFPVSKYVVDKYLPYDMVGQAYHDAKILLNDHWDDMQKYELISNRIFDALAVGAFVISDDMDTIDKMFEGSVVTYKDKEDLHAKIDYYMAHEAERRQLAERGQQIVLRGNTFKDRVNEIDRVIKMLG